MVEEEEAVLLAAPLLRPEVEGASPLPLAREEARKRDWDEKEKGRA